MYPAFSRYWIISGDRRPARRSFSICSAGENRLLKPTIMSGAVSGFRVGAHDAFELLPGNRQRLLDKYVLPCFDRSHHLFSMIVVTRRNHDEMEFRILQDGIEVARQAPRPGCRARSCCPGHCG